MLFVNKMRTIFERLQKGATAALESIKNKTKSYTVERKFLARISVTEFIDRIIQSHIKSESIKKVSAE